MDNEKEVFGTVEPVTEEKSDMIDFGLVENEKAVQHIDFEIEEVVEASAALEQYRGVLKAAGWDGISKQTAKAMLVGLRRIDLVTGKRSKLVASLEDETSGDQKRLGQEKSDVTEDSFSGKAKALWQKFVELIKAFCKKIKIRLSKIGNIFSSQEKKVEELKESLNDHNPNGSAGGRKITIPGRTAGFSYPGGKYQEYSELGDFFDWLNKVVTPEIHKVFKALKSLKGTESSDEIISTTTIKLTPPTNKPVTIDIDVENNNFTFTNNVVMEDVVIPVRERSKLSAILKQASAIGDKVEECSKESDTLTDYFIELINLSHSNIKADDSTVTALREAMDRIKRYIDVHSQLLMYGTAVSGAILNHVGYELSVD